MRQYSMPKTKNDLKIIMHSAYGTNRDFAVTAEIKPGIHLNNIDRTWLQPSYPCWCDLREELDITPPPSGVCFHYEWWWCWGGWLWWCAGPGAGFWLSANKIWWYDTQTRKVYWWKHICFVSIAYRVPSKAVRLNVSDRGPDSRHQKATGHEFIH